MIAAILPELTEWRRDLHAHPELAYQEKRTSGFVAEILRAIGCEVKTGVAKTGVIGILDFGSGPALGIRADMDALPLEEQTGAPYASKYRGVMHACGHDGHTVMALGAARILARRKDLNGKIVFIFQPAEENEGGAERMIREGLFDRFPVDAIFGLHNLPTIPVGEIWAREGAVSASFDMFDVTVTGKGGHSAMPQNAADPIAAAAGLVGALSAVVSRNIAPLDSAVVSVCALQAGETYNVIPATARIKGSCRSFDPAVRRLLETRIRDICEGVARTHGVRVELSYEERYPAVVNTPAETALIRDIATDPENDWSFNGDFAPLMGSEDFSFYLQKKPGCFFIIGNGEGCGPLHSPAYDFNDKALPVGVGLWVRLAERYNRTAPSWNGPYQNRPSTD